MTEPAAAPAAAPPPSAAPAAPKQPAAAPAKPPPARQDDPGDDLFNQASSFHEYERLTRERFEATERAEREQRGQQPPAPRTTIEPPPETPADPNAEFDQDPNAEPVIDPNAPPPDAEAQQAAEQEVLARIGEFMKLGGEPPPELLEVPVTLPNGSVETWGEVMKGFMRRDDHTRGWQEATAIKERSEAAVNAYKQHFDQIEDPDPIKGGEAMYEVYTRGKRRAAFFEAAKKLAHDDQEDKTRAAGFAFAFARREGLCDEKGEPLWNHRDVSKALDTELAACAQRRLDRDMGRERDWELERARKQNEGRVNDEAVAANAAKINKQLDQLRPRAFKALGLLHDAENQQIFTNKLRALVQQTNAAQLTPDLVMDAARMVRDQLDHDRQHRQGAANGGAKPTPRAFTPQLGGGGAPPHGARPEDDLSLDENFARKFGIRSWQT